MSRRKTAEWAVVKSCFAVSKSFSGDHVSGDPARVWVRLRLSAAGIALAVAGFAAGLGFVQPAFAGDGGLFSDQAEWAQSYDADSHLAVPRSTTPVLSQATFAATEQAIERYRQIVSAGGWVSVPAGRTLRLGARGAAVVALRKRLETSGDLDPTAGSSPIFDSFVQAAVKHFQARSGLVQSGFVNSDTFAALNVPADQRLRQLEINLVRLRAYSGNLGERFVMANIPAAAVETVENGVVATHHVAGVGRIDRQSPVMMTKATEINFNPFWTVPASIIRKDLIPKMQANPNYLTMNKIRVFNKEGQEVQPQDINWNSLDATHYEFRQDPGADVNALGVVRIDIPNPYGVYMHDTDERGIFGDDYRYISSGCIRVQDVRDYVAWLLKDTPGWDRTHIDEAIASGQRIDVKLNPPVPVYWVYITAWATPDGLVQFRNDIYQRDGLGSVAAASMTPPAGYSVPMPSVAPQTAAPQTEPVSMGSGADAAPASSALPPMESDRQYGQY
jgi:L,D-transpeptidase YcbB